MKGHLIQCLRCSSRLWPEEAKKIYISAFDGPKSSPLEVFLCYNCYSYTYELDSTDKTITTKATTTLTKTSEILGTTTSKTFCFLCGKDLSNQKEHECSAQNLSKTQFRTNNINDGW